VQQHTATDQAYSNNKILSTKSFDDSFPMYASPPEIASPMWKDIDKDLTGPSITQLEDLEQQQVGQALYTAYSSVESSRSSSFSTKDREPEGSSINFKLLSTVSSEVMLGQMRYKSYEGITADIEGQKSPIPSQMGFSFDPGDDTDLDILAGNGKENPS
jgi:hypothetical protein